MHCPPLRDLLRSCPPIVQWAFRAALLLPVFGLAGPAQAQSSVTARNSPSLPSSLRSALETAERGEAFEKNNSGASSAKIRKDVEKAYSKVEAYLKKNPDDVPSLLLAARLGRLLEVTRPMELKLGPNADRDLEQLTKQWQERTERLQALCDRALAVTPENAEAYYWKARLYGVRGLAWREGKSAYGPLDLASAIRFSQRAVELAPQDATYREALALFLVFDNRRIEALEVMRELSGGRHPLYLLLNDLEAVPLPPESALLRERTQETVSEFIAYGWPVDYPHLRYHMFVAPMSAADIQASWRKTWPEFQLFKEDVETYPEGQVTHYFQLMRWRDNALSPARKAREFSNGPNSDFQEGILLLVTETTNPKQRGDFPIPVGETYCVVLVRNYRPTR